MQEKVDGQVLYLGRWVPRDSFRAFVYNSSGQKLCNSYDDYEKAISSGAWKAEPREKLTIDCDVINVTNVVSIKKRGRKCRNQVKV